MHATIPVTILSGSLGAGKTTLLNHLLRTADERDLAVLVNDMGEVNVDAELVAEGSDLDVEDGVAELSNGCICCELKDDLESAVVRLAREREFDHLIVESSGISEPAPVARLFTTASRVAARYDIDALVTVLDTRLFLDAFAGDGVPERTGETDDSSASTEETRPLSDLLIEQLETAHIVLLNKTDLCDPDELEEAAALVRALQPGAEVIETEFSAVDPDSLFDTDLFDSGRTDELAGWKRALNESGDDQTDHGHGSDGHHDDGHAHRHPDERYGISSFVFRTRRPFHPERLVSFYRELPAAVVRSKGTAWVAGRDVKVGLSQAGQSVRATVRGPWIASLPVVDQDLYRSNRPGLEWHDDHGDRQTELVFIGTEFDEESLRNRLRKCLVDDDECEHADALENPFPTEVGEAVVVCEP